MIAKLKHWVSSLSLLAQPEYYGTSLFEQELASKQVEIFLRVFQTLSTLNDQDEILSYLMAEIHKLLDVDCAVLTPSEASFEVRSHRGFSAALVRDLRINASEGLLGDAAQSGRNLLLQHGDFRKLSRSERELAEQGWETLFVAPLVVQNQTVGLFIAGSKDVIEAEAKKIQFMERFAQIIGLALEQVRHLEKAEKFSRRLEAEVSATTQELLRTNERLIQRVRELKALYEVTSAIASVTTLDEILNVACLKLQDILNVESIGFLILESDASVKDTLSLRAPSFHLSKDAALKCRIDPSRYHLYGPSIKTIFDAFKESKVKAIAGVPSSLRKEFALQDPSTRETDEVILKSIVAVPLITARRSVGVMVLVNPLRDSMLSESLSDEVSDEKSRTLSLIAARIAASLESVLQNQEIQMRLADLSTLQEIGEAFYATPVLEFVLAKIVKIMQKSLRSDVCTFLFYDPVRKLLVGNMPGGTDMTQASSGTVEGFFLDENSVSFSVFREKKSRLVSDIPNAAIPIKLTKTEFEHDVNSMIIIPLKVENEMVGILRLSSRRKDFFNAHHIRLGELIADRAAVIIQNAVLYEKVIEANRELENLNRVKTEFVSVVSHELRTPVTAVKGFVDVVLSEEVGSLNAQQKKFLGIAHNAIDRLTLLISDLLDISRIESGRLKLDFAPISMAQTILDSCEASRAALEAKKIKLVLNVDKKLPQIQADPSRMRQVIDNLMSNAIKFTMAENGEIGINADDMGDFLLISIRDAGVGIEKDDQEKIFEKFVQGDSSLTRQAGGTGLGLAICKAIIEMHGGRIWVESEPGKGATFRFLLPRSREKKNAITKIDRSH